MFKKIKQNAGLIIFFTLVLILTIMIVDSATLPVYGQKLLCGTRLCLCFCVDPQGTCTCTVFPGIYCDCRCPNGDKDHCTV